MPRVIHFEINADDPERAVAFYRDVFGWAINTWGGPVEYWLADTGPADQPGINGAITRRYASHVSTVNTVEVANLDESIEKVRASGGKIVQPRSAVPGVGYMAYCVDTEGNMFGLMQTDPTAH